MTWLISQVLLIASLVGNPPGLDGALQDIPSLEAPQTVNAVVLDLPPILLKIAECESTNRQFNADGSVLRGVYNSKDVGRFQINEKFHLEESKKLGMDIYTWEGNTEYALYLYKKNGTRDWNWSKGCWNK